MFHEVGFEWCEFEEGVLLAAVCKNLPVSGAENLFETSFFKFAFPQRFIIVRDGSDFAAGLGEFP